MLDIVNVFVWEECETVQKYAPNLADALYGLMHAPSLCPSTRHSSGAKAGWQPSRAGTVSGQVADRGAQGRGVAG